MSKILGGLTTVFEFDFLSAMDNVSATCQWMPGQRVTPTTGLGPLLRCIGVAGDSESYNKIAERLAARNCTTVHDLAQWSFGELKMNLIALSLPRNFRAYMSAIACATGLVFVDGLVEQDDPCSRQGKGAGWHLNCTKKMASQGFNPNSFTPDRRCYTHLPAKGSVPFIEVNDEHLYLDLLWLEMQVHPEESLGEYLPSGVRRRLKKIHHMSYPPFKPLNSGKPNEKERDVGSVINIRFQNARNRGMGGMVGRQYKRVIIDEAYKHVFKGKVAESVVFVPAGHELLLDNPRNDFLEAIIEVYSGKAQVRAMPCAAATHARLCDARSAHVLL